MSLYHKYRPKNLKQVVGQEKAVKTLASYLEQERIPHALLFVGPSGCGKTTLARIIKSKLGCGEMDFHEINAADARGIDMVRDIRNRMGMAPVSGKCRVWLIDEAARLTTDAQSSLLKMLEEPPNHVYFMLATTDPQKLLKTIKTRCTEIALRELSPDELTALVKTVAEKESKQFDNDVVAKIVEYSEGSARKALVFLDVIIGIDDADEQLEAIERSAVQSESIKVCRLLCKKGNTWKEMAELLKGLEADPEEMRYAILGYFTTILLSGGPLSSRAAKVIDRFQYHFYESKKAGLALACYDLCGG